MGQASGRNTPVPGAWFRLVLPQAGSHPWVLLRKQANGECGSVQSASHAVDRNIVKPACRLQNPGKITSAGHAVPTEGMDAMHLQLRQRLCSLLLPAILMFGGVS